MFPSAESGTKSAVSHHRVAGNISGFPAMNPSSTIKRIALPVWDGRISPVFDTARHLRIVEMRNEEHVSDREELLRRKDLFGRATRLQELNVDTLICGAVSRPLANLIAASGIELISFVTGEVNEVLRAYHAGRLGDPQFLMPGCLRRGRRRRRCGRSAQGGSYESRGQFPGPGYFQPGG